MEAHPRPLKSVFRTDVRLTVPLFQRAYVWNVADQWLPLWQDIVTTERRFADGDLTPHFLGAVVLQQKPSGLGSLEVREVIDGQQRLTTLQLFIAAVRDLAEHRYDDARLARRLTKLVENDRDLVEKSEDALKLWPTNRDRDAYRAVLDGAHVDTVYGTKPARPVQAYAWFREHIADWVESRRPRSPSESLGSLTDVITDGLITVVIDLTADDDAQVIFETLNARGTPLLASDLIKNLLFRTLETARRPVESLYQRLWSPLEASVWEESVRQGRLKRPRLDAFMNYFLMTFLQEEVLAHDLFSTARRYVRGDADRATEMLEAISGYAEVYLAIETGTAGTVEEQAMLARLRIADSQTVTPLLLWLFSHTRGAERSGALRALESFIVRRSICGWSTANYNRIFLELVRRLGAGERPVDDVVERYLASMTSGSGYWPTDSDVADELAGRQIYLRMNREPLRLLLETLEASSSSRLTEPLADRRLSIEHLLPRSWETNWALPDGSTALEAQALRDARNGILHTIGNLTLVTGSLNSTLSNAPWGIKRGHLLEHSALTLNRSLPGHWDVDEIRARTATLSRVICAVWPRPEVEGESMGVVPRDERATADELAGSVDWSANGVAKSSSRGDIAAHIDFAFAGMPSGTFLTILEISKVVSPAYPDRSPSQGAISARLFPQGRESTLAGVRPDRQGGVRGATKV